MTLRCIDYLTFWELGEMLLELFDPAFPQLAANTSLKIVIKQKWRDDLVKIRRLRNRVAHLRNLAFQDMEDLAGTVEGMRKDLIRYAGWR